MLAKADSYEDRILITGSTAGNQYSLFSFPSAGGYAGYVTRSGDKLFLRQWQSSGSHGGILVAFTDGSNTNWNVNDQDGQQINNDGTSGSWHYRRFDLSSYAGKTISQIYLVQEISTTANPWSIDCTDISMVSLDGSVRPLYNRETSIALTHSGNSAGTASVNHLSGEALSPDTTTTFYHGDHLGSSRIMSSVNGYPVWQATYLPFGYEYNPQITVNHFKFTGKERDSESGLDNFGARFFASTMGRFMTPDWSASPEPVPYADLDYPQSLNLYGYAQNNPLTRIDLDGHKLVCKSVTRSDPNGSLYVGVECHEEPDPQPLGRTPLPKDWWQNFKDNWNQRIAAHRAPPQSPSNLDRLQYINNIMVGIEPLKPTSPNQLNQQVQRGQAPKSVDRVDSPRYPNERPHIEFKDGNALNNDGTWKHGGRALTNGEQEWISKNGWSLPQQ